jgi:hypothetical protein
MDRVEFSLPTFASRSNNIDREEPIALGAHTDTVDQETEKATNVDGQPSQMLNGRHFITTTMDKVFLPFETTQQTHIR